MAINGGHTGPEFPKFERALNPNSERDALLTELEGAHAGCPARSVRWMYRRCASRAERPFASRRRFLVLHRRQARKAWCAGRNQAPTLYYGVVRLPLPFLLIPFAPFRYHCPACWAAPLLALAGDSA